MVFPGVWRRNAVGFEIHVLGAVAALMLAGTVLPAQPAAAAACRATTEIVIDTAGAARGASFHDERQAKATDDGVLSVRRCAGRSARPVVRSARGRARLPMLEPRERVVALSVTDRAVAWRTWRPGASGRLRVGRIANGRVVNRRALRVSPQPLERARDSRIVVTPDGVVAWTLRTAAGRDRTTVWEPGRSPRRLGRDAVPPQPPRRGSLTLVDDQYVRLPSASGRGAARTLAVRRRVSAECPKAGAEPATSYDVAAAPLGDWCVHVRYSEYEVAATASESQMTFTLFLPHGRRTVMQFRTSGWGNQYASSRESLTRMVRCGRWVVAETRHDTSTEGQIFRTEIVDGDRSAVRYRGEGALVTPGGSVPLGTVWVPDPVTKLGREERRPSAVGVVVAPGVLAWADPAGVRLVDTAGERLVGDRHPSTELALASGALAWNDASGARRTYPVVPWTDAPCVEWAPPW